MPPAEAGSYLIAKPAVAERRSSVLEEPQIERCKHQHDSDVHHQSFPKVVPEDQSIYGDDEDG